MFNPNTTDVVRRRLTATAAVVIALGLVTGSALAQTGTLEGTVTDSGSGLPIEGAMLVAWGAGGGGGLTGQGDSGGARYAFTDASGGYTFEEIPAGDHLVFCGKVGYFLANAEATVVEGEVTVLDFALDAKVFGSVSGFVSDAATGEPIAGARVGLRPTDGGGDDGPGGPGGGGFWIHAMTGPDGSYLIEHIPAGEYQAGATSHGYYPSELVTLTVVNDETTMANFALDPLAFGRVEGTVTDAFSNEAIPGAHVVLIRTALELGDGIGGHPGGGGGSLWLHAITGDDGRYALDNVPADDYEARVWAFGYFPSAPVPLTVIENETVVVDFALDQLVFGSIEGTVTDAVTGEPIVNAVVFASPMWIGAADGNDGDEAEGRWNIALTDENGFYRLEDVPAGSWTVRAVAWGYRTGQEDVEVIDGQTAVVDLALEPYAARVADTR